MKDYLSRQLKKFLAKQEESKGSVSLQSNLTPAERVKKTALNTLVRFDIDQMGFDNSSLSMYEEIKRKGVGQDEEEFTDIFQSAEPLPV